MDATQQVPLNLNKPRVLVLNASYEPMHIVSIKRAITLIMHEVAEVLEDSQDFIHSPSTIMPVPSVIRLRKFIRRPRVQVVPFSRRNVLRRDFFTCQYCGSTLELTIDHVMPRSRGGRHAWDNVVTACRECNQKKGNKTPQEAGMPLQHQPKAPKFNVLTMGQDHRAQEAWNKYLY